MKDFKVTLSVLRQAYHHAKRTVFFGVLMAVVLLFMNGLYFGVHFVWLLKDGMHLGEWARLLMALAFSSASLLYFAWRAYGTFQAIVFHSVYAEFEAPLLKLSEAVLEQFSKHEGEVKARDKMEWMGVQLKKLPLIARIGVKVMLHFVPVLKLVESAREALLEKNISSAAKRFKKDLDEHVNEAYFEVIKLKWAGFTMLALSISYVLLAAIFFL